MLDGADAGARGACRRRRPARLDRRAAPALDRHRRRHPMSLNLRGHHPRLRRHPRRRRPLRRGRLPPLPPVAAAPGPGRAGDQRRHRRGPAPLARRARARAPGRRRGGGRRPGHRRAVGPVHRAGGRGGEARRRAPARAGCSCSRSRPTRARRSTPRSPSRTTRRSPAAAACRWSRSSSSRRWAA